MLRVDNLLGLLLSELTHVEVQLLTLEDVAISAARLTRARRESSVQTTHSELLLQVRIQDVILVAGSEGSLSVTRLLDIAGSSLLTLLLLGQNSVVSLLIPLTERSGINLDDGALHESLGRHELVVSGVVDDIQDTGLAGAGLGTPSEVTGIEAHSAELQVTTASTDNVNTASTHLGGSGRTTHLVLTLLLVNVAATTGSAALVTRIARDTHVVV